MSFKITAATGADFVNRKKEMAELMNELADLKSTNGFALYGKRRVGKSSIFKELAIRLGRNPKVVPVYISIWDTAVKDVDYFCKLLAREVLEKYRGQLKIKYRIKDLFDASFALLKQIIGGINFKVPGLSESVEFLLTASREKTYDADKLIEETFNLPERLALESRKKTVLFIDEFPDIMELKTGGGKIGEGVIGKIRGIVEDYKKTSLNVSGSIRKTMALSVLSESSAFYKQLLVREIGPFDKEAIGDLLTQNLDCKKISSEVIDFIHSVTAGIPLYVQCLGRAIKNTGIKEVAVKDVEAAMENFLSQDATIIFNEDVHNLSDKEKLVVIEMATKKICRHSEIQASLAHRISNVGVSMTGLEQKGVIKKIDRGSYEFEDPVFERWLEASY